MEETGLARAEARQAGWEEGYDEGYNEGLIDGYQSALKNITEWIEGQQPYGLGDSEQDA